MQSELCVSRYIHGKLPDSGNHNIVSSQFKTLLSDYDCLIWVKSI